MRRNILSVLLLAALLTSCGGEEDKCYVCDANGNPIDICTANYQVAAANDNLEVNSLDEYIEELRRVGFVCTLSE